MDTTETWTCCGGIPLQLDQSCMCGDRYEEEPQRGDLKILMKLSDVMGKTIKNQNSKVIHATWTGISTHPACRPRKTVHWYKETDGEINCQTCLVIMTTVSKHLLMTSDEMEWLEKIQREKRETMINLHEGRSCTFKPTVIDRIANAKSALEM